MFQSWRDLTFIHWRYRVDEIRRVVPKQLELDTFDGAAWIGLTPFLLKGLRPPFVPPLPWISKFPEMNVRTYVRGPDGKPGIWFFTLEAARLAAVAGARLTYRLPYRWARMRMRREGEIVHYRSRRRPPFGSGSARISVQIREPIRPEELDRFLTARFRLYTLVGHRVAFAQPRLADRPPPSAVLHLHDRYRRQAVSRRCLAAPAGALEGGRAGLVGGNGRHGADGRANTA